MFFTPEGPGSIPNWGTKTPEAVQCSQEKKKSSNIKANTTGKILDKFIMLSVEELLINQIIVSYLYEYTPICIFKYIKYLRFNEITSDSFINELFSSFFYHLCKSRF